MRRAQAQYQTGRIICELQDGLFEVIQSEAQKEKKNEKNEQSSEICQTTSNVPTYT